MSTTTTMIHSFCQQQREWLELELQSEEEPGKEEEGVRSSYNTLRGCLDVSEVSVGLYGRTVVRLVMVANDDNDKNSSSLQLLLLPAHKFTTGDEVEIAPKNKSKLNSSSSTAGVISEVTDRSISVALFAKQQQRKGNSNDDSDDNDDDDPLGGNPPPYSLIPKSSIEVHRKLLAGLQELETKGVDHPVAGKIVRALFEAQQQHSTSSSLKAIPAEPFNPHLDASQLEAISFALSSNLPVSLIHGPPGTGKTTTVVELIQQAVCVYGWKVLVTAPSNVAVDNVLSKLVQQQQQQSSSGNRKQQKRKGGGGGKNAVSSLASRVVRLGHPARLQADILPYSLEARVQQADGTEIVQNVRAELQANLQILSNTKRRRYTGDQKRLAYREIKLLRKEVRNREEKVVQELLNNAQVVLATCVGAANKKLLADQEFDLVIIDEAAQALEAACWIPALRARNKMVLAGDHCQLPPTIKNNTPAVQEGLGKTMFERCMELYGDESGQEENGRVSRMLKVQYRMNESIANWASRALYGGKLETHESVKTRTLGQLGRAKDKETEENVGHDNMELGAMPLLLLDTAGCAMHETENAAGSRYNEGEAQLVEQHVRKLIGMGIQPEEIAVITPYNGQVEILRLALLPDFPKLQIRSVDGFQGGEREAVVLSLVRSSDRGGRNGIGFLRDNRRLNVAVTRAKRHCCVICDTETVSQSSFVKGLIEWIEEKGEQRSALELMSDSQDQQGNLDLFQAELEMQRIIEEKSKEKQRARKEARPSQRLDSVDTEKRRLALETKIRDFSSKAKNGDEMVMSSELTKLDRKLVHEIAEVLGLEHHSEGTEGVDRRIKLIIPKPTSIEAKGRSMSVPGEETEGTGQTTHNVEEPIQDVAGPGMEQTAGRPAHQGASFVALQEEEDDDDDDDNAEDSEVGTQPVMNNVLADLARERSQRARQQSSSAPEVAKKTKPKKKKAQKLGGTKKNPPAPKVENNLDDLDDMAFLDAQIEQVQNSHGRKIEGTGGNYRTIVNGVLLAKGKPKERKRDPGASQALQNKLKDAQNSRRSKTKKK